MFSNGTETMSTARPQRNCILYSSDYISTFAESVYNWANGQTLPLNTDQWSQDEPDMIDTAVRIRNEAGPWKYAGCLPSETFQPLCQSSKCLVLTNDQNRAPCEGCK